MTSIIKRPLNPPAFSDNPSPEGTRSARPTDSIVFVRSREAQEPANQTTAAEAPIPEAAPASTCSSCETFGEVLARIEDLLQSLLLDVENIRVRMDTVLND